MSVSARARDWAYRVPRRRWAFVRYRHALESAPWADPEAMDRTRIAALRRVLEASAAVPFQVDRFREAGLRPEDVTSLDDLGRLRPVTKAEMLAAEHRGLRVRNPGDHVLVLGTSGSSGQPFRFAVDPMFHSRSDATRAYVYRRCGFRRGVALELYAAAGSKPGRDPGVSGFARHILDYGLDPEARALAAVDLNPDLVYGNRSHLLEMADALERLGRRLPNVKHVVSSSETLGVDDRARIKSFYGVAPCDLYGLAEVAAICFETAPGSVYRVIEPRVVMEVLVDGRPALPGEMGEIVVTALDNLTTPFIRYATGDLATLDERSASSGRSGMLIARIDGRLVDTIRRPDGTPVTYWALGTSATWSNPAVAGKIRQWQVEQTGPSSITVRVVPVPSEMLDDEGRRHIVSRVSEAVGPSFEVHLLEVTSIGLEPNGKFKAVRVAPTP